MRFGTHHLRDDRLLDHYFADRHADPLDPPVAEHLAGCEACGSRYAEIARFMDLLREEAEADADSIFTPERLRAQQQQIVRGIEHVGRAARVITFPHPFAKRTMMVSTSRTAPRWIALAAAAGLFVGLALGVSYEWEWRGRPAPPPGPVVRTAAEGPSLLAPRATGGSAPADIAADDRFLSELDGALDRPRFQELEPFDALTPHVRDVRDIR